MLADKKRTDELLCFRSTANYSTIELKDLNDNKFNGFPIHIILSLNVSDTNEDSDKSNDELQEYLFQMNVLIISA